VRATRAQRDGPPQRAGSPQEIIEQIIDSRTGLETAAELRLLRLWFEPDPPRPALQQALRAARASTTQPTPLRAILYLGEIANRGTLADPGTADELLGRAARGASAFMEPYETTLMQIGEMIALTAFERPPFHANLHEGVVSTARFAREVAQICCEHGILIRAVICAGEGTLFEDVSGQDNLASPSHARATDLLKRLRGGAATSALAVEAAPPALVERIERRLPGWKLDPGTEAGCAIWRMPISLPSSSSGTEASASTEPTAHKN